MERLLHYRLFLAIAFRQPLLFTRIGVIRPCYLPEQCYFKLSSLFGLVYAYTPTR